MTTATFDRHDSHLFYGLLTAGVALLLAGLWGAHTMETLGHVASGMDNQVVWGLPHVFAIFLIVAGSGVLNVASVGSVFGEPVYKARAPLSGLLSIALLAGGLMVLMLDLGRPERVIVAATHYNFKSVFAWNVFLYSGMFAIVALYLWTMLERRMNRWSRPAGVAALVWRFLLTTGTGSIFGFLVARQAYQSALLAPMFIVLSFGWGKAVFLLAQAAMLAWNRQQLDPAVQQRLHRLLGVFVAASLYLVAVYHGTNLYYARQHEFEAFILLGQGGGGLFAWLLWGGYVGIGTVLPLVLLWQPRFATPQGTLVAAAAVIVGAFSLLYVFIIGGQAFPLAIFPGHEVSSAFGDGVVAHYVPRWPEWLLGLGGLALAFVLTAIGMRALDILPTDTSPRP
jgi:Ni/Fe-hydrogenase subunit HybB-like protein